MQWYRAVEQSEKGIAIRVAERGTPFERHYYRYENGSFDVIYIHYPHRNRYNQPQTENWQVDGYIDWQPIENE